MQTISMGEYIIVFLSVIIMIGYHCHLYFSIKKHPFSTAIGLAIHLRRTWVAVIMEDHKDIVAVQTLRNWIMAASFLASTAILINLGILSVAFSGGPTARIPEALHLMGSQSETLWKIKLIILLLTFFFAFFNFSLTIRYYNHVNFMINVPPEKDKHETPEIVAKVLNQGAKHYSFGMRGYYMAIPFTLWLFGPLFMLAGTVILAIVMYGIDHNPKDAAK